MNATSPLVHARGRAGDRGQRADDPVVVDQRRDEVAGEVERLGVALAGDVAVGADVGPGHDVPCRRTSPIEPVVAAEGRHLGDGGVGQPGPRGELEAVVAEEPDGGRVGTEGALRLVDDHPDELGAIVRGGQPAGDAEDACRATRRARPRPGAMDCVGQVAAERSGRLVGRGLVADRLVGTDDPPEDRARPPPAGVDVVVRAAVDGPSQAGGSPRSGDTRAHGPMVASRGSRAEPPSVLGRGVTIVPGAAPSVDRPNGPDYTPRASRPLVGRGRPIPHPRPTHPRGRRSQSHRRRARRLHREPGPSRLLTADRDPSWSRHLRRDVPPARWHPCST